jgi:predicted DCC family thiol-disulfide oxidoreductase YuxK
MAGREEVHSDDRRPIVLYDQDCGFCRWSMAKVLAWDRDGRLRPLPLQDPEADRLTPGMAPERRMGAWHLVLPEGEVLSAGAAVPALLRLLPGGRPLATVAGALPNTTDRLYRGGARHRDRLGSLLGQRACAVDPARTPGPSGRRS